MKISESTIHLSSFHASEEADFIQQETSTERRQGKTSARIGNWTWGPDGVPEVWVDRVSISSGTRSEIQSQYSGALSSRSTVRSQDGETLTEFGSDALAERMVGAAIDRQVTLRTLRDGDDIRQGNDIGAGFRENTARGNSVQGSGMAETLVSMNRVEVHYETEEMEFSSQGKVVTQDGREIDFSLDLNLDRAFLSRTEEETLVHTWKEKVRLVDPLVISLDGRVPELTDTRFEFDLDNDGTAEEISFVAKGSGFLSFDRNGDGKINNGSELFGPGTGNGFGELSAYDEDGNNWIDENDAVFSQLSVWTRDDQGNDVLVSLKEAGVGAIYLDNARTEFSMTGMDNELKGQMKRSGVFLFENGNVGSLGQVDLAARAPEPSPALSALGQETPAGGAALDGVERSNLLPGTGMAVIGGEDDGDAGENPLNALLEQIEKLKEELRQIFGQDREEKGRESINRFRRGDGFSVSDFALYRITRPDPVGFHRFRSRFI
ncbi:MAG: hypothetical protein HUN04_07830 [Desulfobacter sp.]|nr:MAG: hypothetical protein HUN04_07830 [Desulfobacter sp.]